MNKIFFIRVLLFSAAVIIIGGCSGVSTTGGLNIPQAPYSIITEPYYEVPLELKDDYMRLEIIDRYRNYLKGLKIFLDPGHGGEDKRNKSIMGKIIEAEVNLKVAEYLKEFLEESGAVVFMSRYGDETVDLDTRAAKANDSGADIFISIHHNASAKGNDYWTNYTSTFYHSKEGEYDYEPCVRDLARYIQRDLAYVMRNPGGLVSFDGTVSDYVIFPGEGFYVLRKTEIPGVLIECAFFTNRMEEQRLAIDEFNRIQAWGIFRGLAKYFISRIPTIDLLMEQSSLSGDELQLVFQLSDKSGINPGSIKIYFNGAESDFIFDDKMSRIKLHLKDVQKGEHTIRIICANKNGNHSFPYNKTLLLK